MFRNADSFHLRSIALWTAVIAVALLVSQPVSGQTGLGLRPMRLELELAEGAVHAGSLTLSNESSRRIRVRSELLDFNLDDSGTPQFERVLLSEAPYTCRPWLSLNPREVELEPGSSVDVRYTLRVPAGVQPQSFNCAAGFTTLPPAGETQGLGIRAAVRMVAAFYVIVGNPAIEAEVAGISLEPAAAGAASGARGVILLRNWSTRFLRPGGELAVLDEQGNPVEVREIPALPILPNRLQRILLPLETAPQPGLRLRARVDLGLPEMFEAIYTFSDQGQNP